MLQLFFWAVMVGVLVIIAPKVHEGAYNNMMGYKKVDGKLVQIAYPDHYTFPMIFFCYYLFGFVIFAIVFFGIVAILDFSGLSEKFIIQTIFHYK